MKAPMAAPKRRYQNTPLKVSTAAIDAFLSFCLNGTGGAAIGSRLTEQHDDVSTVGRVINVRGWALSEEQQAAAAGLDFEALCESGEAAQQEVSIFKRGLI